MYSPLWNKVFGTAIDALTSHCTDIGAFLLDHRTETAEIDRNGLKLLGISSAPDYGEVSSVISQAVKNDSDTSARIIIAEKNDDITAGFIHLNKDRSAEYSSDLPVYSYAEFISAVTQSAQNSLLALLQIEEYGNSDLNGVDISTVLTAIIANTPKGSILSASVKNRFWLYIPDFTDDKVDFLESLQRSVKDYLLENSTSHRNLTFSAGCGADVPLPSQRMQTAEFTLFDATAAGIGTVRAYSDERYERQKTEYENMRRFSRLVDGNLFRYHFQPIASARNGDIIAYEALMRTDSSIGMNPLEVLGAATKLGRLYDIEKATMRNALEYISDHQEEFGDRKLFVNSIPAHILSYADWDSLVQDYGELMQKLVIEMTEQTELDDDRLAIIHDRLRRNGIKLAIDDYGTGYSNASNLLRYTPDYVKIDRSLIEGINANPRMQKFVSGIIEFIHENGYSALAEGVETREELSTMIQLGADLIQGYYISKPKPFTLHRITDALRNEIAEFNLMLSENNVKVYHPEENEVVDLSVLMAEHYGSIFAETENITIEGIRENVFNCPIIVKDGLRCNMTLRNANITTEKESPVITLGVGADVTLNIDGRNEISSRGIWVPQTASLRIVGEGSLHVHCEVLSSYGIGVDKDNSPGNITVECSGKLRVDSNGENAVAIGGGKNTGGTAIRILNGDIEVHCSGGNCVGIGNFDGSSVIDISKVICNIELSASSAVGIGSLTGSTDIMMENYAMNIVGSGVNLCGIGSLKDGDGKIYISSGTLNCDMHGRSIVCVGADKGDVDCIVKSTRAYLYCEGGTVCGVGDINGSGNISLKECGVDMTFLCKDGLGIGSKKGSLNTENVAETIKINE